jgi:hypothetical protein
MCAVALLRKPDKDYFELPSGYRWTYELDNHYAVLGVGSDEDEGKALFITCCTDSDVMYVCSNDDEFAVEITITPDAIIRAMGFLRLHFNN